MMSSSAAMSLAIMGSPFANGVGVFGWRDEAQQGLRRADDVHGIFPFRFQIELSLGILRRYKISLYPNKISRSPRLL